jgi:hypothetical protein
MNSVHQSWGLLTQSLRWMDMGPYLFHLSTTPTPKPEGHDPHPTTPRIDAYGVVKRSSSVSTAIRACKNTGIHFG